MSLIRLSGNDRRFRKKAQSVIRMFYGTEQLEVDGKTPYYFLEDPEDSEVLYVGTRPFTLAEARNVDKAEL